MLALPWEVLPLGVMLGMLTFDMTQEFGKLKTKSDVSEVAAYYGRLHHAPVPVSLVLPVVSLSSVFSCFYRAAMLQLSWWPLCWLLLGFAVELNCLVLERGLYRSNTHSTPAAISAIRRIGWQHATVFFCFAICALFLWLY